MEISIVSPVYNAELFVSTLINELHDSLQIITHDYEIILVEDNSQDNSWEIIREKCKSDARLKGIRLSRNFGQHFAITAGLKHATGDWIVVMDCDLQDRPDQIQRLYLKAQEGYDIVLAKRVDRRDSKIKKLSSKLFYLAFAYFTGTNQDSDIASFGIYKNTTIQAILEMGDRVRVFPVLVQWIGFKKTSIDVRHDYRRHGKSAYSYKRLISLAFNMIISFSDKPLKLITIFGFLVVLSSFIIGSYYLFSFYTGVIEIPGYASIIISIWFLSGTIITFMGILGLYLSKVFDKVKDRPLYLIRESINITEN